jgi:hypothetical protein
MLRQTAHAEATDPRDRIFSLIGFLKPEVADILKPDYSRSIGSVCAAATYAYMLEMGVTAALSRVRLSLTRIGECPKPSWAIVFDTHPDFDEYTSKSPFECVGPVLENASTSSDALQFSNKLDSLKLQGWIFDQIGEIVDHPSAELPAEYNSLFAKFMAISKKAGRDETYLDTRDWLDYPDSNQSRLENEILQNTPGSNPYMSISPIEAAVRNPSYRPFRTGSSPADHSRRIKRELRGVLLSRREWMRKPWADWDKEFEKKVCSAVNEWNLHNAKDTSRPREVLLQRLRVTAVDSKVPSRKWSARLNFGLYHYTDDFSICPVNFMRYADAAVGRCVVFITKAGFVGVAPTSISKDDVVVILSGSTMPVILRWIDDHYTFQGLAYVLGIMHDEMSGVDADTSIKSEWQTFVIW